MKTLCLLLLMILSINFNCIAQLKDGNPFDYVSPVPGSKMNSKHSAIAIKQGLPFPESFLPSFQVRIQGSVSGSIDGKTIISDDNRTLIFKPDRPFTPGETVSVKLSGAFINRSGTLWNDYTFTFDVSSVKENLRYDPFKGLLEELRLSARSDTFYSGNNHLPPDFPPMQVNLYDHPSPGYIFAAPFSFIGTNNYLTVLDNKAVPLFAMHYKDTSAMFDFKRQKNGVLTFYGGLGLKFYALNDKLDIVDSFAVGNGYFTDIHELQLMPKRHAWLMAYDPQPVRMDTIVPGGNPNAIVSGLIIQELDASKNVVFQWRSWDHVLITDAVFPLVNLTDSLIDYIHGNAIEVVSDTNFLISSRHLEEITNIDRRTGEIIWRMGSSHSKHNQFTFLNDTITFSAQHDIRLQTNGHYTIFDNGNLHTVPVSSALEYDIDPVSKIVTLIKRQYSQPGIFGPFMGDVQHFSDSNYIVGWGAGVPNITEFKSDGSKALEIQMPVINYRAFRFNWKNDALLTASQELDFDSVPHGTGKAMGFYIRNNTEKTMFLTSAFHYDSVFRVTTPMPVAILPQDSALVSIQFTPEQIGDFTDTFTINSDTVNNQFFKRISVQIEVKGKAVFGIGMEEKNANGMRIYPNPSNGKFRIDIPATSAIFDLAVFDEHGTLMLNNTSCNPEMEIDLSGFPKGIYLIRMTEQGSMKSYFCKQILK